jgi:hypothetical protein
MEGYNRVRRMSGSYVKLVVVLLILGAVALLSGCSDAGKISPSPVSHSSYTLPISERSFYIGMVPTPRTVPTSGFDDIVNAYEEAGEISEVTMVWVSPQGIGQYDKLMQNKVVTALRVYGLKPVVTLSFATVKQVPGEGLKYVVDAPEGVNADLSSPAFRKLWVEEAGKIAREFKPEYFSLGNEVNDYFYLHPGDLDTYLSLYDEAYAEIKKVSPGTKVFVVFSYEHMIDNDQFDMLKKFDTRSDLIGLTTYPWSQFDTPGDIPADYYSRLNGYTNKPIAFTEIGWISSGGTEREQADFLVRFLELTKSNRLEMVNWLFLHETALSGEMASVAKPETGTISLKNADGSKKEIYGVWLDLKALKKV